MALSDHSMLDFSYITKHFNRNLALAWALIALSTFNFAFDQQGFNSTQAMAAFTKEFGEEDKSTGTWAIPTYFLSLLQSLVYVGFVCGAWIGSLISARWGRRMTIFIMSLWAMCAATIMITSSVSNNRWQMLVGRVLNYIYIGMELSSVPVYQAEIAPAAIRGFAVGSYQLSLGIGGVFINSICRGTSELQSNAAWQIPYGLFYVVPTIVASLIWYLPESPRWLLMKDRDQEAFAALQHLRGDAHVETVGAELALLRQALAEEQDTGTYKDLFTGVNRRRTGIICGLNFFFQATGNFFAGHYGALFVQSLGTVNPFSITVSQSALNSVSSLVGILMIDKLGRRPLYLGGSLLQAAALVTMGALGTPNPVSRSLSQGIIAMMMIFNMIYVAGVGPLNYVLTPELCASRLRDKSVRVGATVNIATIFVVSFTLPYLLDEDHANLGSKVGFIYGGFSLLGAIFAWFCLPEVKDRSLEEIETMFQLRLKTREFKGYQAGDDDLGAIVTHLENNDARKLAGDKGPETVVEAVAKGE